MAKIISFEEKVNKIKYDPYLIEEELYVQLREQYRSHHKLKELILAYEKLESDMEADCYRASLQYTNGKQDIDTEYQMAKLFADGKELFQMKKQIIEKINAL